MSSDDLLIPEGHTLLHIGPQKTGSTGIQQAMHEARAGLAAAGVFYPGPAFRPAEAGWAVMGIGSAVGRPAPRRELWDRLVDEVASTRLPRVCVSDEDFARADDAAIERILSGLGEVHLVFVARRLDKLLPSHWQERIKARMTWSYPEFLEQMISDSHTRPDWEWHMMWDAQDVGDVVDRWAKHLDRSQITVIVSSETDREVIPRGFERLLGLESGMLVPPTNRSNRSLSYAEAEAVRRVNQVWADQHWSAESYWRIVQAGVAKKLKNSPGTWDDAAFPGLPAAVLERVAELADRQAEAITAAGVRVIGDPDTLRIRSEVAPAEPAVPLDAISLDLLSNVMEGAVSGALELRQRSLRQQRRQIEKRVRDEIGGRELIGLLRRRAASRLRRSR